MAQRSQAARASNVRLNAGSLVTTTNVGVGVTDINTLLVAASNSGTSTVSIPAGGTLRFGSIGGVLITVGASTLTIGGSGVLTAGGAPNTPGELILNNDQTSVVSSAKLKIDSSIQDNGTGKVSVVYSGAGTKEVNGLNTYSGGTTINTGRVLVQKSTSAAFGAGPVTVHDGGQVWSVKQTFSNDFVISGVYNSHIAGALRVDNGTLNGTITLAHDAGINISAGNSYVNGRMAGPGALVVLEGAGKLALTNAANDYAGGTILTGGTIAR
jgi:fibronectin-binding autotransporter adhesin